MSGLFATFNIAKRGMNVTQKQIDVTTHNISNANTEGFSRQRANSVTTKPFGMPSINSIAEPGQLGTGAQIESIQRIRDTFLDFQVRNETSTKSKYDTRANYLGQVESIFNEPSDTGISTLMGKFYSSWQELAKQPNNSNARTVVAQQSLALADELNHTSNQLTKLVENSKSGLQSAVVNVNSMLDQINQLNQEIRAVKVAGNEPNDLMDKRDLLLDKLSTEFNLNVDKKALEGNDVNSVDGTSFSNDNSYFVRSTDDQPFNRLSVIDSVTKDAGTGNLTVTYYKLGNTATGDNKQTLTIEAKSGDNMDAIKENLERTRVLMADKEGNAITEDASGKLVKVTNISSSDYKKMMFTPSSGEIQGLMSIQTDVNGYMDQLNKLAKTLAYTVNTVYTGETDSSVAGQTNFFVKKNLDGSYGVEDDITAANITINKDLVNDVMKIQVGGYTLDASGKPISGVTDGSRALAIAQLKDALVKIDSIGISGADAITTRKEMFTKGGNAFDKATITFTNNSTGTKAQNYFKDTVDRLGVQSQEAQRIVTNQESLLASFQQQRDSVSGVSIDEEVTNLVQFQHAYSANAKIISTIDQLLDVVVNGLKR